jgi:PAS domain S-box-containing protein
MKSEDKYNEELMLELEKVKRENQYLKALLKEQSDFQSKYDYDYNEHKKLLLKLNKFSSDLAIMPYQEIFPFIVEKLKEFFNVKGAWITSYDEKASDLVVEFSSFSILDNSRFRKLVGKNILKFRTPVSADQYEIITTSGVGYIKSVHELTFGAIPDVIGKAIEKIFSIGWFVAVALMYQNRLYGTMVIMGDKHQKPPDKDEISAFAGVASNAIGRKKAEEALIEKEEYYRRIFDNSSEAISIHNAVTSRILDVNDTMLKVFGYEDKSELIGKKIIELSVVEDGFDWTLGLKIIKPVIETGTNTFQWKAKKKNGEKFWVEVTLRLMKFGKEHRIVAFSNDITLRRKTEDDIRASEEKYRTLFRNQALAIGIRAADGKYFEFNDLYSQMLGYSEEELAVLTQKDLTHPDDYQITVYNMNMITSGKSELQRYEKRYISKSGDVIWAEVCIQPLKAKDGSIIAVIGTINNITERKKAELLLQEQNTTLEAQYEQYMILNEKLRQTNYDLETAIKKAEESDRLKTAFLQNMSHEIRTPLNGIIGFSNLLAEEDISREEIIEYTGIIRNSGKRLLEIVNNILDISKIETGQLEVFRKNFSINELFANLHSFFMPMVNAQGLSLTYQTGLDDEHCIVNTDEAKLNQILVNLINNAIKFTSKGSIHYTYEIKDNYIHFSVKDTGIGIDEEHLERIFERFTQIDASQNRGFEGAGLGLAICKGLIELLGGEIWIESIVDSGTTFFFTIPYSAPHYIHIPQSDTAIDTHSSASTKILIVEDDVPSLQYLSKILTDNSYSFLSAGNGEQALELIRSDNNINLVLMDIRMPVMDGIEATKEIKRIRPDIPIIAQTAFAFSEERSEILEIGCDDYISKPINKKEMLTKINKCLKKAKV